MWFCESIKHLLASIGDIIGQRRYNALHVYAICELWKKNVPFESLPFKNKNQALFPQYGVGMLTQCY